MTRHNKEPWTADPFGNYIKDGQRKFVCQFFTATNIFSNAKANSKRIVECVNALEGIDKPSEFISVVKQLQLDAYPKVKKERDQLRELIEDMHTVWKRGESIAPDSILAKAVEHYLSK